jgi:hypothetical protein
MSTKLPDRTFSFSVKPMDTTALEEVTKLKEHCAATGANFSFYVIQAIKKLNKELNIK